MSRLLLLVAVLAAALSWPSGAAARAWRWPLQGEVGGRFRVTPATPFAAGQRRGIDVVAPPGTAVRAACQGLVAFAGAVPGRGLAVTVRCGALAATYLRLGSLRVRAGERVYTGARLGGLGASGLLRLGARRMTRRFGYVDPLTLLREPSPEPPRAPLVAPRALSPPRARSLRVPPAPSPRAAPSRSARLPLSAWIAVGLVASALPLGGLVDARRRRRPGHARWEVGRARL